MTDFQNLGLEKRRINDAPILSDLLIYKNKFQKKIVGFFDHLEKGYNKNPFIILPPAYAETKKDYLSLSYYLVVNGFNVIRYDNTYQLGESEGDIRHSRLMKMTNDLRATLDYVEARFRTEEIAVFASSLAARIAMRIASEDRRIKFLMSLVGVANLQNSLKLIYRKDLIKEYKKGVRWGSTDIMGFEIEDDFLGEAINENFYSINDTINEAQKLKIPIVYLVAENDAWIDFDDAKRIFDNTASSIKEFVVVPTALHQLQENPKLARSIIMNIALYAVKYFKKKKKQARINNLYEPKIRHIVWQNKRETLRLKKMGVITKESEISFWDKYLSKYVSIMKSEDFKEHLSFLLELMGIIKPGMKILDAGCGNGHFGAWLLTHILNKQNNDPMLFDYKNPLVYIGLDFISSALEEASKHHEALLKNFAENNKEKIAEYIRCEYILSDLEKNIMIPKNSIDKICCNFVISYVNSDIKALNRLSNLLKSGGRIVVSSLKPYADLSLIYSNYASQVETEDELTEGRKLLSAAGQIRQKEKEGHYRFYTVEELLSLVKKTKLVGAKAYRSFGNQANIVVAEKK